MNKPEDRIITIDQIQSILKQLQDLPFMSVHIPIQILLSLKGINQQDKDNKVNKKDN